jgi:hypothetical protein
MRIRDRFAAIAFCLVVAACGGGGGTPDAGDDTSGDDAGDDSNELPVLRHELDTPDDELALAALQRLGAPVDGALDRCGGCHPLTHAQLRDWRLQGTAITSCLEAVDLTSQASALGGIACIEGVTGSPLDHPRELGFWASAGRLPWFERLFEVAYGAGSIEYQQFAEWVAMPPPSESTEYTQDDLDVVAEWFIRGQPQLSFYIPPDGPSECNNTVDDPVLALVDDLRTTGWRALNAERGLAMYGCAGAATALECMADQPRATERDYSATWEVAPSQLRLLAELPGYHSSYWTRSSADGRFVAHGGGDGIGGSTVIDLIGDFHIGIDAAFDPSFLPDNSGFVFQGAARNTCRQSVLLGRPTAVTTLEPGCTDLNIALYEHLGAIPDGDYFASFGNYVGDGGSGTQDPSAYFGAGATSTFLPFIYDGTNWVARSGSTLTIPYEGDAVVSPSARMVVNRMANGDGDQLAFVVRALEATPSGSGYSIAIPKIGQYCMSGGKPGWSYDERWLVFHHSPSAGNDADAIDLGFESAADPLYAPYVGVSNIYLLDLTTGARRRITMMAPNQHAVFPHFRSDGWIYFIVKAGGNETIVASDAALRLE